MTRGRTASSEDLRVDADIERATSLPPRAFTDPQVLAAELATVFSSSWLLIPPRGASELRTDPRGLTELVARRGAFAPIAVLERPLFLQRDWRGALHCFPNACTHAWHALVEGPGRERVLTCPQHGRQFSCDGRFLRHSGFGALPGFPQAHDHLRDLPLGRIDPLLFLCVGTPTLPFAQALAPVRSALKRAKVADYRRMPIEQEVREVAGNWKQHASNYLDSYHIPFVHRAPGGLAEAVDLGSYTTLLFDQAVLQHVVAKDPRDGLDPRLVPPAFRPPKGQRLFALWWFVFPNLTLNLYPWGLSVNLYAPLQGDPSRTLFHWYHFAADLRAYRQREQRWFDRRVDDEDTAAMAAVHRGLRSGALHGGRFSPTDERGPHWFHHKVSTALATAAA